MATALIISAWFNGCVAPESNYAQFIAIRFCVHNRLMAAIDLMTCLVLHQSNATIRGSEKKVNAENMATQDILLWIN